MHLAQPKFFDLPREIRDRVYDYIWVDTGRITQRYKSKEYMVTYGELSNTRALGKAEWLLVSSQMLREGLEQLHRHSRWYFASNTASPSYIDYVFPLNTPAQARVYSLGLTILHHHSDSHRAYLLDRCDVDLGIMLESRNSDTPLTTIEIGIWRWYEDGGTAESRFDFSPLESLAAHSSLQKLTIQLKTHYNIYSQTLTEGWSSSYSGPILNAEEGFMNSLAAETSRVGRVIVPGGIETATPFEDYWVQYRSVESLGFKSMTTCWEYTIERQ
ncbi:hypothetical protein EKO04_009029 [Ascochyta lentis]|uniref:Uncharacterized protein n=1 Tax=Ascochyta lentis TaxID=205686 RepID=A0A8H7MH35_9PLEO|nr:hypothetical protein EKO04_009029 [Ascochyta lentis]